MVSVLMMFVKSIKKTIIVLPHLSYNLTVNALYIRDDSSDII